MLLFRRLLMLASLLLATSAWAQQIAVPALKAHVTDTTGTLTSTEQQALDGKLAAFEERKGSQLAVLVVASTGEETIEQFGIRVAEAWKLGRKNVDDGAILIVAKDDRALRIEVGYGLEGAMPDAIAKRIVAETITPYFRNGDFYTGIAAGVDAMIAVVDGEPLPAPSRDRSHRSRQGGEISPLGVIAVIIGVIVGFIVRFSTNRFAGAGTALIVSGVIAALLIGLAGALMYAAFSFIFVVGGAEAALYGMLNSRGGRGGGGFGGGGFSGGGGGFGGGGASGRW